MKILNLLKEINEANAKAWENEKIFSENYLLNNKVLNFKKWINFLYEDEQYKYLKKIMEINKLDYLSWGFDNLNIVEYNKNIKIQNKDLQAYKLFCKNVNENIRKINKKSNFQLMNLFGELMLNEKKYQCAKKIFNAIIEFDANNEKALTNLSALFLIEKNIEIAKSYLELALTNNINSLSNLSNLGTVYRELKEYDRALICYKAAYTLDKENVDLISSMGSIYLAINNFKEAERMFEKGLIIDSNNTSLLTNYGTYLCGKSNYTRGLPLLLQAGKAKNNAITFNNIANVVSNYGEQKNALKYIEQALILNPNYKEAYSNKLFISNYDQTLSPQELYKTYLEVNSRLFNENKYNSEIKKPLSTNPTKIKVGFVSADFNRHALANFLLPLLHNLDRNKIELYLYNNSKIEDETFREYCSLGVMKNIYTFDDLSATRIIVDDEIDVLIDLSGHTSGNRLGIFKNKPSKVSATWVGYNYTTGMSEIDYFITDDFQVPSEAEQFYSEKIYSLGKFFNSFNPINSTLKRSDLPFLKNKYITFGTLSRGIRINDLLIEVWGKLLAKQPNSILRFDSRSFSDPSVKNYISTKFNRMGIPSNRLSFGNTTLNDALSGIDIVLDNFPHNSGTTLFESIFMGCPFITLVGQTSLGRLGGSINNALELNKFNAYSYDEYIDKAIELSSNINELVLLRKILPERIRKSIIMDHKKFAVNFENFLLTTITKAR